MVLIGWRLFCGAGSLEILNKILKKLGHLKYIFALSQKIWDPPTLAPTPNKMAAEPPGQITQIP